MADVISLSARVLATDSSVAGRGSRVASTTSGNGRSSLGNLATVSTRAVPLSSGTSSGVVGASTGAALGSDTLSSLVGLQATDGSATAGATATGGQATAAASTATDQVATTTTTQESETVVERGGQVVHITRTIEIDANGLRKVVAESRRVIYGTTLASIAYQNAQALTGTPRGTVLGVG